MVELQITGIKRRLHSLRDAHIDGLAREPSVTEAAPAAV